MLIYEGMCTEINRTLSLLGAKKIAFPPKSDGETDGQTLVIVEKLRY